MSRLDRFIDKTQGPLDFLALCTLWIVLLPFVTFGRDGRGGWILVVRLVLTAIYAADFIIRIYLAENHRAYARKNWLSGCAAILPPIRVLFSVRLLRKLFQRGNLVFFLTTAGIFVINLAITTFFFERNASGATITSVWTALWWAMVTVTTVGYGDYTPVTVGGRITGALVMSTGIVILAVVTAQISSTFVSQRNRLHPDEHKLGERLDELEAVDRSETPVSTAASTALAPPPPDPALSAAAATPVTPAQRIKELEEENTLLRRQLADRSA